VPLGEFDLIRRFFARPPREGDGTVLGVGDDCALLRCPEGSELAVTVDTLVAGIHFLSDVDPERLGHKALAANLSDLAAMGAEARWTTLALTLPAADAAWLEAFAKGFFSLADRYGVDLVGGDTTRGPLSITVQAMGLVPAGSALRRSGARQGDTIYLSGPVGAAGLGLKARTGSHARSAPDAILRLERPEPRLEHGQLLRGLAGACIDVSDGLAADLGHILTASGVGAAVEWESVPLTDEVRRYLAESGDWSLPLVAGDDYELCFTVSPAAEADLLERLSAAGLAAFPIGRIEAEPGLRVFRDGAPVSLAAAGYQHFSPD
jgi:thiamine-monophosphate kinase